MTRRLGRSFLLTCLFLLIGPHTSMVVWAQASSTERTSIRAGLGGVVDDSSGLVLVDIPIVITRESDKATVTVFTTQWGTYEAGLSPGRYRVTIDVERFEPIDIVVDIQDSQIAPLDLTLIVRRRAETVTVARPAVALLDTPPGTTLSRATIDAFPLNARSLSSLLAVVPGVVTTESMDTLAEVTAIGQQRFGNGLFIDGVPSKFSVDVGVAGLGTGTLPATALTGSTLTLLPLTAVEEMRVLTGVSAPAEAGPPGARTMVVTRAGSDRLTLSALADVRPPGLAAPDWFAARGEAPRQHIDYVNTGATVGGPLLFRKLFSFTAWEHQRIERSVVADILVPSLDVRELAPGPLRTLLNTFPTPNGKVLGDGAARYTGPFTWGSTLSAFSSRVDTSFSANHHLFARVNRGVSKGDAIPWVSRQMPYSYRSTESTSTWTGTMGLSSTLSPSVSHDLRINVSRHQTGRIDMPLGGSTSAFDVLIPAGRTTADTVVALQLLGAAGPVIIGQHGINSQAQQYVGDTWTLLRGRHTWRFGAAYRLLATDLEPAPSTYTFTFRTPQQFAQGGLGQGLLAQRTPSHPRWHMWSGWMQDTIRARRLSVTFGGRYTFTPPPSGAPDAAPLVVDAQSLPKIVPRMEQSRLWRASRADIAPSVTMAYDLGQVIGRETVLHAGWGVAFDDAVGLAATAYSQGFPLSSWSSFTSRGSLAAPDGQPVVSISPNNIPLSNFLFAFPEHLRTAQIYQWTVGIDQRLSAADRLELRYVGAAGRRLPYRSRYEGGPLDPTVVFAFSAEGTADYHGLLTEYVRHLRHGLSARVVYTWSHSIDTYSGEQAEPNPPTYLIPASANRGSSDFDRRHVLEFWTSYTVPDARRLPLLWRLLCEDWRVDLVGIYRSGAPVTVTGFRDLGVGYYEMRPDVVPGVPVRVPDTKSPTGYRLNLAAFHSPVDARQGTLGRNTFRSTPLRQVDIALSRSMRFRGGAQMELRVEAFNVFNLTNWGPPETALEALESFGLPNDSYAKALGSGTLSSGGGRVPIEQVGWPRSIQVSIRFGYH